MSQEAGIRNQKRDEQHHNERRDPGRYLGCSNGKVRIRPVGLDSLHCDESEHPYAKPAISIQFLSAKTIQGIPSSQDSRVHTEDRPLDKRVK
jgi:hypothetical protein